MNSQWKEPPTNPIKLFDGRIIRANVNGTSLDGQKGWAFAEGREIPVEKVNDSDMWKERKINNA